MPQIEVEPISVQPNGTKHESTPDLLRSSSDPFQMRDTPDPVLSPKPSLFARENEASLFKEGREAFPPPPFEVRLGAKTEVPSLGSRASPAETLSDVASRSRTPVEVIDVWGDLTVEPSAVVSEGGPRVSTTSPEIPLNQSATEILPTEPVAGALPEGKPINATAPHGPKFIATTEFCATSRKVRGRKRNVATDSVTKLLRDKRTGEAIKTFNQSQQASPSQLDNVKSQSASTPSACAASSNQDEARTGGDGACQITITDLPNEIIEAIALHLKPPFEPVEEITSAMRVVIWDQDDNFNPTWSKDLFGLSATCKRFRNLLYDRNRFSCIQVADSEEAMKSMVKSMPISKRGLVK